MYAPEFAESGSTIMRGYQLAELLRSTHQGDLTVRYLPTTARPRATTIFLTKGALKVLDEVALTHLRARGNRLLFDVVDEPAPATEVFADALVAASATSFSALTTSRPQHRVLLVNHHVDPRIESQRLWERAAPSIPNACGYFGELGNARFREALTGTVDFVHVDTARQSPAWLDRIGDHALHYAVRQPQPWDGHKPFLKGFTAAHCGAAILLDVDDAEARSWLGTHYPLTTSAVNGGGHVRDWIQELLDAGPLDPRRVAALDHMRELRERSSAASVLRELEAAVLDT